MSSVATKPTARRARRITVLGVVVPVAVALGVLVALASAPSVDPAASDDAEVALPEHVTAVEDADDTVVGELGDEADDAVPYLTSTPVTLDRDPFEPVIAEPQDPDTVDPDDPLAPDPDDPTAPDPDDPTAPDPGDPTAPGPGVDGVACQGGETELVCNGRVLTLTAIERDEDGIEVATIVVDGDTHLAGLGDVFADDFVLQGIAEECVTIFTAGESHRLCLAEVVLK